MSSEEEVIDIEVGGRHIYIRRTDRAQINITGPGVTNGGPHADPFGPSTWERLRRPPPGRPAYVAPELTDAAAKSLFRTLVRKLHPDFPHAADVSDATRHKLLLMLNDSKGQPRFHATLVLVANTLKVPLP